MKRFFILLIVLFAGVSFCEAQSPTRKQFEKAADSAFVAGNYRQAYEFYKIIYLASKGRYDLIEKYADAARLYKSYKNAEIGYLALINNDQLDDHPLAPFWLGVVRKYQGEYALARELFKSFLQSAPNVEQYYIDRANKEINDCYWAESLIEKYKISGMQAPDSVLKVNWYEHIKDTTINTKWSDFSPVWAKDSLIYTSFRFPNKKDEYRPPRPVSKVLSAKATAIYNPEEKGYDEVIYKSGDTLKNDFNHPEKLISHATFNYDKTRMYYTRCEYVKGLKIGCRIYFKEKQPDGSWGKSIDVGESVNKLGTSTTQPSVGYDIYTKKESLYFTVADTTVASDTSGIYDIYYVSLNEEGKADGTPVNFQTINTKENDITPFFDSRFQRLYFSSKGYKNIGGYDIYRIEKTPQGWGEVEHMGLEINSSYDDAYFSVDSTGELLHWASNRDSVGAIDEDSKNCCYDIFFGSLRQPVITLQLTAQCINSYGDSTPVELDSVQYRIVNLDNKQELLSGLYPDGKFEMEFLPNRSYTIYADKKDYTSDTLIFDTYGYKQSDTIPVSINLKPTLLDKFIFTTYDQTNNAPLYGVSVDIIDNENNVIKTLESDNENRFVFNDLKIGETYNFEFSKPQFLAERRRITIVPTNECKPDSLDFPVYLTPLALDTVRLYFDNNRPFPNPVRRPFIGKPVSNVNYERAWERYYLQQRSRFTSQYNTRTASDICKDENGQSKFSAEDRLELDTFFDRDVQGGMIKLRTFQEELMAYLENPQNPKLIIYIRGFASPKADSIYNKWLTDRRINSVEQYLQGVFDIYYPERVDIKRLSFGEDEAEDTVVDEDVDKCLSEYAVDASKERRVEILGVRPDESATSSVNDNNVGGSGSPGED